MGQRRGNGLSESRPRVTHLQRPLRRETALKFSKLTQPPPPAAWLCRDPSKPIGRDPSKPISCSPRETWPLSHRLCAHLLQFSRTARQETVTTRGLKHSLKPAKSPPTPKQNLKGSCDRLSPIGEAMRSSERCTSGVNSAKAVKLHVCGYKIKGRSMFLKPRFSFRSGNDIPDPTRMQRNQRSPSDAHGALTPFHAGVHPPPAPKFTPRARAESKSRRKSHKNIYPIHLHVFRASRLRVIPAGSASHPGAGAAGSSNAFPHPKPQAAR